MRLTEHSGLVTFRRRHNATLARFESSLARSGWNARILAALAIHGKYSLLLVRHDKAAK